MVKSLVDKIRGMERQSKISARNLPPAIQKIKKQHRQTLKKIREAIMNERIGFMDKVDFEVELGNAPDGNRIFMTSEELERHKPCVAGCGIVKVAVRLLEVVRPGNTNKETLKKAVEANEELRHDRQPRVRVGPRSEWLSPTGTVHTVEAVDGETVRWVGGGEINCRELNNGWGRITRLRPQRFRQSLKSLVDGITPENAQEEVDFGPPQGKELL